MCGSCGNLRSECSDEAVDWHPRTTVCWATASREWGEKELRRRHEKDDVDEGALHPLAGKFVWVSSQEPPEGEDEFAD